jgi:hypothetical protein
VIRAALTLSQKGAGCRGARQLRPLLTTPARTSSVSVHPGTTSLPNCMSWLPIVGRRIWFYEIEAALLAAARSALAGRAVFA